MKIDLVVQMNPMNLQFLKPEELTAEKLMEYATFGRSEWPDYVTLGVVTLDVEIDTTNIAKNAVVALRVKQADIRAKATAEANKLEGLCQQLLCIENKPAEPVLQEIVKEFSDAPDA